jgi:hypothetical protein
MSHGLPLPHGSRAQHWSLRVAGLVLLAGAALAGRLLADVYGRHAVDGGLVPYALAAATFLLFGAGGMLATLGRHLFDRIAVSGRWAAHPAPPAPAPDQAARISRLRPLDLAR